MYDDKLYTIAMQCARLNDQGCACQCHVCQFNIFNYVKDVREASLLKANAYTDYFSVKENKRQIKQQEFAMNMGPLIVIALIIAGIMWCCSSVTSNPKQTPLQLNRSVTSTRSSLVMTDEVKRFLRDQNNVKNIPGIIDILPRYVYDVNGDGVLNCIDYSCVFRQLYGTRARLMINNNPKAGMNHMFVVVTANDGSQYHIEPQGTRDRYMMSLVWGVTYDKGKNIDVTSTWGIPL